MTDDPRRLPLKSLHPETSLVVLKLRDFEKLTTKELKESLTPGKVHCLKTRPDGTILDGHHRIYVLRNRGEDVDGLAREVVDREDSENR